MTTPPPRCPWWWKKRCWATAALATALSYPLSFVPAVWLAARLPVRDHRRLQFVADVYEPVGMLLLAAPRAVRHGVYGVIEPGMPEGVTFLRTVDDAIVWHKGQTFTTLHAL